MHGIVLFNMYSKFTDTAVPGIYLCLLEFYLPKKNRLFMRFSGFSGKINNANVTHSVIVFVHVSVSVYVGASGGETNVTVCYCFFSFSWNLSQLIRDRGVFFNWFFFSFALLRVYMQTKLPAFARTSRVKKRHSWNTRLNKLVYKYTMDIRVTVYDNYRMWFNIIRIRYLWLLAKETVGFNFPFRYLRVRIRNGLFRWSKITTNRERGGGGACDCMCICEGRWRCKRHWKHMLAGKTNWIYMNGRI